MLDFEFACKESFERRKSIKLMPWERETLDIIYQVAELIFENGVIADPVQYKKHRYLMFRPSMAINPSLRCLAFTEIDH